jgi:hypothetical protein
MVRMEPQCTGKTKYPTKASALRRIDYQLGRQRAKQCTGWGRRQFQAYRCPCCLAWHVGGTAIIRGRRCKPAAENLDEALLGVLPLWHLRKLGGVI